MYVNNIRYLARGLNASFMPSPSKLKVKSKTTRTPEGTRVKWGSLLNTERFPFSKIITPRLGVGG